MTGKLLGRLRDPSRSGVYRVARRDAIDESGLGSVTIDLQGDDPLRAVAKALKGDIRLLLLCHAERLATDERGVLLDLLRSSAAFWAERGTPFFAVFVDPDASMDLPPRHRER